MSLKSISTKRTAALIFAGAALSVPAPAVFPDNPTNDYKAVGMIGNVTGKTFKQNGCGVAIAPTWVVGVAHVGGNVFVEEKTVYPIIKKITIKLKDGESPDLALYQLAKPVPYQAEFLNRPLKTAEIKNGAEISIVGYGNTATLRGDGKGWDPAKGSEGVRRVATNRIDLAEEDRYNIGTAASPKWKTSDAIAYDLDKPGDDSFSSLGGGATSKEGGMGAKDSGGGWFINDNGKPKLVAVGASVGLLKGAMTSPYRYGGIGFGVYLWSYRDWIGKTAGLK